MKNALLCGVKDCQGSAVGLFDATVMLPEVPRFKVPVPICQKHKDMIQFVLLHRELLDQAENSTG